MKTWRVVMRIAIVDDEKEFIKKIVMLIPNSTDYVINVYADSKSVLEDDNYFDAAFLDVEVDELTGLELADIFYKANPKCVISLFTAHKQYAIDGYKHNIFDYILKDDAPQSIRFSVSKTLAKAKERLGETERIKTVSVNLGKRNVLLNPNDILYLEANNKNVRIFVIDGEFCSTNTIAEFEAKWSKYGFWRCHRSYIINCKYISSIDRNIVKLNTGIKIPIGRKYREGIVRYE